MLRYHFQLTLDRINSDATSSDISVAGNIFSNVKPISLYNIVIQTYISTAAALLISGSVIFVAVVSTIISILYANKSVINVRNNTENSMLYCLGQSILLNKIESGGSNNSLEQQKDAFKKGNLLYCREQTINNRLYVIITNNENDIVPNKVTNYF